MYLTETQLDILRSWAEQTPQVQEAYLFGSYAKGEARAGSDVDIAIRASAVDWTFRTAEMGAGPNESDWGEGQHPHARASQCAPVLR